MTASPYISLPATDAPQRPEWPALAKGLVVSEPAMDALATRLARLLEPGDTLLLSGGVGAGKTHLARALIRARLNAPQEPVPSPTFTLVQTYATEAEEIWHADLYRLGDPGEVAELGLDDAMDDPESKAICLIEWPDRLAPDWPNRAAMLHLERQPDEARWVTLMAPAGAKWASRLLPAFPR